MQKTVEQVQPIGELVALGAKDRAHQLHRVELTGQRFDIGAIAHNENGSQIAPLACHVSRRYNDDPVTDGGERRVESADLNTSSTRGVKPISSTGLPDRADLEEIGLTPRVLDVFRSADSTPTLATVGDRIVVVSARHVAREGRDLGTVLVVRIAPTSNR